MSADLATNVLWIVWYVTWIAAVVWSAKTKSQMKSDMFGLARLLFTLGLVSLFLPTGSGTPLFGVALLGWCDQKLWHEPAWAAWVLFALVAAAFGFCWCARLHLGRLWSGFVTLKEGHRIIDTGPYRLVRHPIYSGIIFAALATAIMRGTPLAITGLFLIAAGLSLIAKTEERFLRAQLGADAYDAYSRRVGMLFPMIG